MKYLLILLACVSSLLPSALAKEEKVELPKGSYISPLLERAKADADETQKLLAFLLIDLEETDKTRIERSNEFIKAVKDKAVVVHVSVEAAKAAMMTNPKNPLPAPVVEGFKQGDYLPKLVLTDAKAEIKFLAVSADSNRRDETTLDFDKTIKEVEKAVKNIKPVKPSKTEKK